jgi:hypothetical protein
MATTMRQPFDPTGEYIARRSFTVNGHSFSSGDDFPFKRFAIDTRKLYRLWDNRFIDVKGEEIPMVEVSPEPVVEEVEETEEVGESETVDEGFIFDPEVHTLDRPDDQWWIMKAGEKVLRVNRKEWKRLESKTKPNKVREDRIISED